MDKRREYFESKAEEWDKRFTAEDLEIVSFLIDSFNIEKGYTIVDLACGTGILFDMLRRKVGKEGAIIGIDFCGSMVKRAAVNFPFENIYEIDADVTHMPLVSKSVDMAISFSAYAHFEDPKNVMLEVSRILKPGSFFHIIHLHGSKEFAEHHAKVGGPLANDFIPSFEDMMQMFELGNFVDVKIQDHPGLYLASGIRK
jgi:demethylmenaquinone methyltransferase/2-methoxy-6-polyprenyl-1,4-benzoquinol methylase